MIGDSFAKVGQAISTPAPFLFQQSGAADWGGFIEAAVAPWPIGGLDLDSPRIPRK